MGRQYSAGGYRIALVGRSKRTLVVEGKDDKEFFERYRNLSRLDRLYEIDTSDIFTGPEFTALGAKAKIDKFLSSVPDQSSLEGKLRAFVDREWEGLSDASGRFTDWTDPEHTDVRRTTTGHSIENYSFNLRFVTHYLNHFGSNACADSTILLVRERFSSITSMAAAVSEVISMRAGIGRCGDLFSFQSITWREDCLHILPDVTEKARRRGLARAETFLDDVVSLHTSKWALPCWSSKSSSYSHGHIGENFIWAAIGSILAELGATSGDCAEISSGRRDERRRTWHIWAASDPDIENTALRKVFV